MIALFTVLLSWREWVRAGDSENIRTKYSQRLDELKLLTETSPPKAFLNQYDELFRKVVDARSRAIRAARASPKSNEDTITRAFRFVLDAMLQLARRWDSTTEIERIGKRVYRANIMWCLPKDAVTDSARKTRLIELGKTFYDFDDVDAMFEAADGFLKVDIPLSTKESTDNEPDTEINDLMLIFNVGGRKSTKNIDGAPIAAASGNAAYVLDTSNMREFAKQQKGFTRSELDKIEKYYQGDDKGRSIISLPIPSEFDETNATMPIAAYSTDSGHPFQAKPAT